MAAAGCGQKYLAGAVLEVLVHTPPDDAQLHIEKRASRNASRVRVRVASFRDGAFLLLIELGSRDRSMPWDCGDVVRIGSRTASA